MFLPAYNPVIFKPGVSKPSTTENFFDYYDATFVQYACEDDVEYCEPQIIPPIECITLVNNMDTSQEVKDAILDQL